MYVVEWIIYLSDHFVVDNDKLGTAITASLTVEVILKVLGSYVACQLLVEVPQRSIRVVKSTANPFVLVQYLYYAASRKIGALRVARR